MQTLHHSDPPSPHLHSVAELREAVSMEHKRGKEKEQAAAPQASYGYGGRFGVEKDRMDKVGCFMTS